MPLRPLATQIVGSYAKPHWLLRHERMAALDDSAWRPEPEVLAEAKRDAVRLALLDQERAGLSVLTDGEAQRAAYDRHFFARLDGVARDQQVRFEPATEMAGRPFSKRRIKGKEEHTELFFTRPRVVSPIGWPGPLCLDEFVFASSETRRPLKVNVVGPLTAANRLVDEHYGAPAEVALAVADALNHELRALEAAGARLLQIDEPMFHFEMQAAADYGIEALNRMVHGLSSPVVLHLCYGYAHATEFKTQNPAYGDALALAAACDVAAISLEYEQPGHQPEILTRCGDKHVLLGLLNLGTEEVEAPEHIAERLAGASEVVPVDRLHPCSDCGMWFLPRPVAFRKISALVEGTKLFAARRG